MDSLTANEALAVLKDLWLSRAFFSSRGHRILQTFLRRVKDDPQQKKQLNGLIRLCKRAFFGPALSTSRKRLRAALCVYDFRLLRRDKESFDAEMQNVGALRLGRVIRLLLNALQNEDAEFFHDLAIAIKSKPESQANAFLAAYTVSMFGKQPVLSRRDIGQILHIGSAELRRKIRDLQKRFGVVVPLKAGRIGRPPKK